MGYEVHVMAMNKKGKSSSVTLQGYTVKSPEKQTGKEACNYDYGFVELSVANSSVLRGEYPNPQSQHPIRANVEAQSDKSAKTVAQHD